MYIMCTHNENVEFMEKRFDMRDIGSDFGRKVHGFFFSDL